MATPQGSHPAPEPGWMRASDADRERVVDRLKTAFIDGMLTTDELGERVGRALVARSHADLATVTADIPAGRPAPPPRETEPSKVRHHVGPRVKAGIGLIIALTGMLVDAALTGANAGPMANGFYVIFIGIFLVAFVTWLWTLSADNEDSPGGQAPRPPAPGRRDGPAPRAPASVPPPGPRTPLPPPSRPTDGKDHFSERRVAFTQTRNENHANRLTAATVRLSSHTPALAPTTIQQFLNRHYRDRFSRSRYGAKPLLMKRCIPGFTDISQGAGSYGPYRQAIAGNYRHYHGADRRDRRVGTIAGGARRAAAGRRGRAGGADGKRGTEAAGRRGAAWAGIRGQHDPR